MVEYLKRYTTYNSMQYLVILATISTHELLFFSVLQTMLYIVQF